MASSQVEFASSTSPFGCMNTSKRNHRERYSRESNINARATQAAFSHFVRDHLNNNKDDDNSCSWVPNNKATSNLKKLHFTTNKGDQDESSSSSSSSSPSSKPSSSSVSSNLGASSLVQIWEKRLTQSDIQGKATPRSSPNASSASPQGSSPEEADCESESESSPQAQNQNEINGIVERERVRVVDIIKRLTATSDPEMVDQVQEQCCVGMGSQWTHEQSENRGFGQGIVVNSSPRIRGRQAFNDLLMQMERDRHAELHNLVERAAVSKFAHRGRIQSMLRLRLMQRSAAANDQCRSQVIRQPHGSAIMRLRQRFSTGVENGTSVQPEVVNNNVTVQNTVSPTSADQNKEETPRSSDVTVISSEAQNVNLQDNNVEASSSSMADLNAKEIAEKVEGCEEKHDAIADQTSYDEIEEEEEGNHDEIVEEETSEQHYDEARLDWISQISRPKSYWEDRRQAWYKEMLDTESKNEDIRQLIQCRTVSNFLSSELRERMDRLMESHKRTQANLLGSQEDQDDDSRGRMEQLVAFLQQRMRSAKRDHEEEIEDEEEGEEEEEEEEAEEKQEEEEQENLISGSYNEESDSNNQCLSRSFCQDSRQYSSSANHQSMEMKLVYDLRGHMEQLYHEMSELRKSIKSCIDMQMVLQKSMNRETRTDKGGVKSHDRALKKGKCCICYVMKADSLFYRCGHMCACLKCATEMQWNNGICPICQAPIVDVVPVYIC